MSEWIELSLDQDNATGGFQLSIGTRDKNGGGHGYRIFGPKYIGDSTNIRTVILNPHDVDEIRVYLDKVRESNVITGMD